MFSEKIASQIDGAFEHRFSAVAMPDGLAQCIADAERDEAICLKFNYAYMPASDMADYPATLFLRVARHALELRKRNLFNEKIPDEIFLNFVMQCRVNNENLEFNREYFLGELLPRIKGKSAEQAALEVNYWCLEKVTYISTDIRTMSPFTLIKNTIGRCGEESVFTVSALRSVGIPARQVYTPRWAHCESNHAWVEAYVGGRWHFIGACEPEPALDKSWFTVPASKGMLIYTKLFSPIAPEGEEIAYVKSTFCEINLTGNYVNRHAKLRVRVRNGNEKVKVRLQLVNSCELYSIVTLIPDEHGEISLTIGKGDVYVHVTDGDRFITKLVDVNCENEVDIDFSKANLNESAERTFVMKPPVSHYADPDYGLSPAETEAHDNRLSACHEVRKAFAAGFADRAKAENLAKRFGAEAEDAGFFENAKGNLDEIIKFFERPVSCGGELIPVKYKIMLLRSLKPKDFTDCTGDILSEHLEYAYPFRNDYREDIFERHVLCPRLEIEMITAFRKSILNFLSPEIRARFCADPRLAWEWVQEHVKEGAEYRTDNDHRFLVASPAGLLRYPYGGEHSRKLMFVAVCRTLGVAARINEHDGYAEYFLDGDFVKVVATQKTQTFKITMREKSGEPLRYNECITLAKLENGVYSSLQFPDEHDCSAFVVERGHYRILTGRRLENEAMSVRAIYVNVEMDTAVEVEIPRANPESTETGTVADFDFGGIRLHSILSGNDAVAFIRPSHEPTEHLLLELSQARAECLRLGVRVVLATMTENDSLAKLKKDFGDLATVLFVKNDDFAKHLAEGDASPPVLVYTGGNAKALYRSQGYHAGSVLRMLAVAARETGK